MHYHIWKNSANDNDIINIFFSFPLPLKIYSRFLLVFIFFCSMNKENLGIQYLRPWQQQRNANFLELYYFPNFRSMWHTGIIYISSAQQYIIHFFYCCFRTAPLASIFLAFAMFAHTPPPPHVTTLSLWVDAMGKRMMMDWTTLAAVI